MKDMAAKTWLLSVVKCNSAAHDVTVANGASEADGMATRRSPHGTIIGEIGASLIQ
jgi:hypothetical protein